MTDLRKMFPDATGHSRLKPRQMDFVPMNDKFRKSFLSEVWTILLICLGFAVAAVILLVMMGGLKVLGVKSLES